jgi:hypothetical protein
MPGPWARERGAACALKWTTGFAAVAGIATTAGAALGPPIGAVQAATAAGTAHPKALVSVVGKSRPPAVADLANLNDVTPSLLSGGVPAAQYDTNFATQIATDVSNAIPESMDGP